MGTLTRKYILVSPVKDEEKYVEATITSIISQSIRPLRWIIVDDGSTDATALILDRYASEYDWIQVIHRGNKKARQPGSAVIDAFDAGLEVTSQMEADFIVKLDCDVRLPNNYFELLLERFDRDSSLGIASGVYLEQSPSGDWVTIPMPAYHAAGACKTMRMECFRQIGGFVRAPGWDTVDEIKAQVRGWKTCHFDEVKFQHLKQEGSGIGTVRTSMMHGKVYFLTGGSKSFFLLKVLHRMVSERPLIVSGLALAWGFLRAVLSGEAKLVSEKEARFYARCLNRRIWEGIAAAWRPGRHAELSSCD